MQIAGPEVISREFDDLRAEYNRLLNEWSFFDRNYLENKEFFDQQLMEIRQLLDEKVNFGKRLIAAEQRASWILAYARKISNQKNMVYEPILDQTHFLYRSEYRLTDMERRLKNLDKKNSNSQSSYWPKYLNQIKVPDPPKNAEFIPRFKIQMPQTILTYPDEDDEYEYEYEYYEEYEEPKPTLYLSSPEHPVSLLSSNAYL